MTDVRSPAHVLVADTALAVRIDRAEASLCADFARALRDSSRVLVEPIAGGFAVYAGPGAPMNKVVALGLDEPLHDEAIARVEALWRSRREAVRVELAELARPDVGTILTGRGYRLIGFEDVMGLGLIGTDPLGGEPAAVRGLSIERPAHDDVADWVEVTVNGWMELDGTGTGPEESFSREALEDMMLDFVRPAAVQRYLARLDGVPVAAASVRLYDGLAQLCGATTLPAFRRRGIQTALLSARLSDARAAGCDLAVVTTAPGSKSQANARRQGFQQLYARAVLVRSWEQE